MCGVRPDVTLFALTGKANNERAQLLSGKTLGLNIDMCTQLLNLSYTYIYIYVFPLIANMMPVLSITH